MRCAKLYPASAGQKKTAKRGPHRAPTGPPPTPNGVLRFRVPTIRFQADNVRAPVQAKETGGVLKLNSATGNQPAGVSYCGTQL